MNENVKRDADTAISDPPEAETVPGTTTPPVMDPLPSSTMEIVTNQEEFPRAKVFNSQDFMNFLTNQVDIANLMIETKDGQRLCASFYGSSIPSGTETSDKDPPGPPNSIFKSLEMLKSFDLVDNETVDPAVLQSTVSLEYLTPSSNVVQAQNKPANCTPATGWSDPFVAREWAADYKNSHVEVSYSGCIGVTKNGNGTEIAVNSSSLPPKKRATVQAAGDGAELKTDWDDMFKQALAPLVDAASVAQREHHAPPGNGSLSHLKSGAMNGDGQSFKKRVGRRKPRKIIPENKLYTEFKERDVLFGRGGRSNHHPGNKVYREIVIQHQEHYRICDKNEKTKIAQGIVDQVLKTVGGRFLELDKDTNRWYIVPNVVARRKVGQALRENNTEEARAAKRAKYQGKYSSIASKKAAEVNAAAAVNMGLQARNAHIQLGAASVSSEL